MKRIFHTIIGLLGIVSFQKVNAASYTHNLIYTSIDAGTLTGTVTFDSTDVNASQDQGSFLGAVALDQSLITDVTFTYRIGGVDYNLSYGDIAGFVIDHKGTTDYSSHNLLGELNDLAFVTDPNQSQDFELTRNGAFVQNADLGGGVEMDDFRLTSTTYHSPGPLPLLGLFTAFSSIKKLKRKYRKKYNF